MLPALLSLEDPDDFAGAPCPGPRSEEDASRQMTRLEQLSEEVDATGHLASWKEAALSEEVDATARDASRERLRQQGHSQQEEATRVDSEGWTIWHHGKKLSTAHQSALCPRLEGHRALEFWTQGHHIKCIP